MLLKLNLIVALLAASTVASTTSTQQKRTSSGVSAKPRIQILITTVYLKLYHSLIPLLIRSTVDLQWYILPRGFRQLRMQQGFCKSFLIPCPTYGD